MFLFWFLVPQQCRARLLTPHCQEGEGCAKGKMDHWEGCVWIKCCGFSLFQASPLDGTYIRAAILLPAFLLPERMRRRKTSVSFQSLVSQQRSPAQGLGALLPFWVFVLGTHLRLCWVVLSNHLDHSSNHQI